MLLYNLVLRPYERLEQRSFRLCIGCSYGHNASLAHYVNTLFQLFLGYSERVEQIEESKVGRKTSLTPEIQEKLLAYIRKGLTYERAGEALGISPATIQNWQARNKQFDNALKKARRDLEVSLLDSINLAGEKSWQARAWILERSFLYSQPSARLQVSQDVTHGISSNLASLLAGIAIRKKSHSEKIANPQNDSLDIESKQLSNTDSNHKSHTKILYQLPRVVDEQHLKDKTLPRVKHKRMRLRKPRKSSLPTTTPPATPPAPA